MTTDIKRLLRRRQKAFSRARHTNKTKDWARYKQLKTTVQIKVITKLPNSEQSYKGKVQTHNYINRQNQSTTGKL